MKNVLSLTSVAFACALFAVSATGCGKKEAAPATTTPSATETAPATTPAAPAATTTPATTETAPATTGDASTKKITITNKTTFDVNEIYLSPVNDTKWGSDILGDNDVLKPDQAVEGMISCGMWDAKLVAADGSVCILEDVDICAADIWNVTADCPAAE